MGKIACQVSDVETDWTGFLVDADAESALEYLPKAKRAKNHADPDIVKEAWEQSRTIVTSNADDFLRYISIFQNPPNDDECRDLWGLPALRQGLDTPEGLLRWLGAGFLNLYVRLTGEGQVHIQRFKQCSFCEHPERGVEIKEPWNSWYRSLHQHNRPPRASA